MILPTFNRATLLPRSIESVLNQTYKSFQLWIIDDGSTDETSKVLDNYQIHPQIHVLRQANLGVSAARNLGIRSSNSPWIALIDSDDEWLPGKLKTQKDYIDKNPTFQFLHSEEIWVRNGLRVNAPARFSKRPERLFERSLEHCLVSPSTSVIMRSLLDKVGVFDESLEICEDYDLWLRIMLSTEMGYIETPLIQKYGGHIDQLSLKDPVMDYWRVKSLINLLNHSAVTAEKLFLIKKEIAKKIPSLLMALKKLNHSKRSDEITQLISPLNFDS